MKSFSITWVPNAEGWLGKVGAASLQSPFKKNVSLSHKVRIVNAEITSQSSSLSVKSYYFIQNKWVGSGIVWICRNPLIYWRFPTFRFIGRVFCLQSLPLDRPHVRSTLTPWPNAPVYCEHNVRANYQFPISMQSHLHPSFSCAKARSRVNYKYRSSLHSKCG